MLANSVAHPAAGSVLAARPSTAFATSQEFLAETALLRDAQSGPADRGSAAAPLGAGSRPRGGPARRHCRGVLADTSEHGLADRRQAHPDRAERLPSTASSNHQRLSRAERRAPRSSTAQIDRAGRASGQPPNPDRTWRSRRWSRSAWRGHREADALAMLATLSQAHHTAAAGRQIVAEQRITLGGLKGSVPVSIDNRLGYAGPGPAPAAVQPGQRGQDHRGSAAASSPWPPHTAPDGPARGAGGAKSGRRRSR